MQFIHGVDDALRAVLFKLTGFSVAPTASERAAASGSSAVHIGPTVTDHDGTVSGLRIVFDMLKDVSDNLILVQTAAIHAGAIQSVHHVVDVEMLADCDGLRFRLAGGHNKTVSIGTQRG